MEPTVAGGLDGRCMRRIVPVLLALSAILAGCGRDSGRGLVGPSPDPASPVFAYVDAMVGDPWFAESLPGLLRNATGASQLRALLQQQLPRASASRDLGRLSASLECLRRESQSYRTRPGFDPGDSSILSALDLFVEQALAIRDGTLQWSPSPILQRVEG